MKKLIALSAMLVAVGCSNQDAKIAELESEIEDLNMRLEKEVMTAKQLRSKLGDLTFSWQSFGDAIINEIRARNDMIKFLEETNKRLRQGRSPGVPWRSEA